MRSFTLEAFPFEECSLGGTVLTLDSEFLHGLLILKAKAFDLPVVIRGERCEMSKGRGARGSTEGRRRGAWSRREEGGSLSRNEDRGVGEIDGRGGVSLRARKGDLSFDTRSTSTGGAGRTRRRKELDIVFNIDRGSLSARRLPDRGGLCLDGLEGDVTRRRCWHSDRILDRDVRALLVLRGARKTPSRQRIWNPSRNLQEASQAIGHARVALRNQIS
jgi:hypothetical protein